MLLFMFAIILLLIIFDLTLQISENWTLITTWVYVQCESKEKWVNFKSLKRSDFDSLKKWKQV